MLYKPNPVVSDIMLLNGVRSPVLGRNLLLIHETSNMDFSTDMHLKLVFELVMSSEHMFHGYPACCSHHMCGVHTSAWMDSRCPMAGASKVGIILCFWLLCIFWYLLVFIFWCLLASSGNFTHVIWVTDFVPDFNARFAAFMDLPYAEQTTSSMPNLILKFIWIVRTFLVMSYDDV